MNESKEEKSARLIAKAAKVIDEWGIGWQMPKGGGHYYDLYLHPLANAETVERIYRRSLGQIHWTRLGLQVCRLQPTS